MGKLIYSLSVSLDGFIETASRCPPPLRGGRAG